MDSTDGDRPLAPLERSTEQSHMLSDGKVDFTEGDEPTASLASPAALPDIMNDPSYNTNVKNKQKDGDDVDTCRICRGEGSQEEALFYPCKCSGSIKFVHQNCLMEWLAHSQKKHCELCKTPFRFTKLYHPQMPNTVPIPVFVRQAALHSWATFQTWTRFQLVFFVWVFWLPWCMRTIWRGLFWVGDGAWVDWSERDGRQALDGYTNEMGVLGNGSTPRNVPLFGSKSAAAAAFVEFFGKKATKMLNSSPWRKEPMTLSLAKRLYHFLFGDSSMHQISLAHPENATSSVVIGPRSSTWLSDVPFLSNVTRSTTINHIIIDTLEGQMITICVVVAFILIFLIREWVMQQQQNMLLGPGGDNQEAGGPNIDAPEQQQQPGQGALRQALAEAGPGENEPRPRMFVRPRRRLNRHPPLVVDQQAGGQAVQPVEEAVHVEEPFGTSAAAVSRSASRTPQSQPLLPRKRNNKGEIVNPPIELEDLLRESPIFQNILQRVRDDPSLEIMRIIKTEIPSYEVDNLLQRLSAPAVAPYLQATHFTPPPSPTLAVPVSNENGSHDLDTERSEIADEIDDFELVDYSRSGSEDSAKSHQSFVDASGAVGIPQENLVPPQPATPKSESRSSEQEVTSLLPKSRTGRASPPGRQLHSTPTWTFDDVDDNRDVESPNPGATPSEDPPLKVAEDEDDLLGESAMIERLNADDPAIVEAEGSQENDDSNDEMAGASSGSASFKDQGYVEAVKNWLWGGVTLAPEAAEQQVGDDEHVVNDIADEAPFVPVAHGHPLLHPAEAGEDPAQDPEILAAAAQAGIDPNGVEGVDEIEDLEGIMELIGMEGPLAGLMQNGMFCAVLVSLTIVFGVWIPYLSGKVFLILVANPVALSLRLLRLASTGADMVVDVVVLCAGSALYVTDKAVNFICQPVRWILPALSPLLDDKSLHQAAQSYAEHALDRLLRASITMSEGFTEGIDVPTISLNAHESLRQIGSQVAAVSRLVFESYASVMNSLLHCSSIPKALRFLTIGVILKAKGLVSYCVEKTLSLAGATPALLHVNPLRLNLAGSYRSKPPDFSLAEWDATDRALAVVAGYTFFALLGVLYLFVAGTIRGTNNKGLVNGSLAQVLYQAGGVMKVILIISIEMIVFPLYCGLLLDVALLPLFGDVTLMSRVDFSTTSPWTSVFVHWFVGTCYMFHFALFVSMCRKIMRTGVLYFIRDPDDPTFHPVRDVLERSVSSQLWKISFSAMVYGGLVLVCLGGVVWGIAYTCAGVFPIHWSSDEPVLEFPVDLLFYNFLMPMAVKFFKPSIALNKIYGWWFRKCARLLRLSSFLFNDTRSDEEGRHVRRTWTGVLHREQGDIRNPVIGKDRQVLAEDRGVQAIFLRDGKYVRTPGSDQVRIPKGATTFVEVDENDNRLDGIKEGDEDPHGRKMSLFMKVYIPPFFRIRIAAFICLIWLFAAFTGVSVTVIPLLFGRWVFARLTPNHLRMNDIYAFSIGIYILGGVVWALLNHSRITNYIYSTIAPHTTSVASMLNKTEAMAIRTLSLLYAYFALGILLPCLFSLILEFYIIVPLHTYILNNTKSTDTLNPNPLGDVLITTPYPVIHVIQDWTLGVLYVKMFTRLILWTAPSRPALALRAIVARGWLDPDIRLATRAFIFPATLVMVFTLIAPLTLGWVANNTILYSYAKDDDFIRACVYRYSYPAVLALGFTAAMLWLVSLLFSGWRRRIRDEVYLIGERLHNFGEGARAGAMSRVRVGKMAVGREQ